MNRSLVNLSAIAAIAAISLPALADSSKLQQAQDSFNSKIARGSQAISNMPIKDLHNNADEVEANLELLQADANKAAALQAQADQAQAELKKLASTAATMKGGEYLVKLAKLGFKTGKIKKSQTVLRKETSMDFQLLATSVYNRTDLYSRIFIQEQNLDIAILQSQTDLNQVLDTAAGEKEPFKQKEILDVAAGLVTKLIALKAQRPSDVKDPNIDDVIAFDEKAITRISALLTDEIRDQNEITALNAAKERLQKELAAEHTLRDNLVTTMTKISDSLGVKLSAEELLTEAGRDKLSAAAVAKSEEARTLQAANTELTAQIAKLNVSVSDDATQIAACQAQIKSLQSAAATVISTVRTDLAAYHEKYSINPVGRYGTIDTLEADLNRLAPAKK